MSHKKIIYEMFHKKDNLRNFSQKDLLCKKIICAMFQKKDNLRNV